MKLTLRFGFEKPKSNKNAFPTRCDTSNLIKAVEDALNNHLWLDDRLISHLDARQEWAESNYVEIRVEAL